ncbi:MAG: hypothetical protein KAI17_10765, partial [Thiotrichaceae bacterium]|nr:hypothetical protein [Thiotrichaceae bacterium]
EQTLYKKHNYYYIIINVDLANKLQKIKPPLIAVSFQSQHTPLFQTALRIYARGNKTVSTKMQFLQCSIGNNHACSFECDTYAFVKYFWGLWHSHPSCMERRKPLTRQGKESEKNPQNIT